MILHTYIPTYIVNKYYYLCTNWYYSFILQSDGTFRSNLSSIIIVIVMANVIINIVVVAFYRTTMPIIIIIIIVMIVHWSISVYTYIMTSINTLIDASWIISNFLFISIPISILNILHILHILPQFLFLFVFVFLFLLLPINLPLHFLSDTGFSNNLHLHHTVTLLIFVYFISQQL